MPTLNPDLPTDIASAPNQAKPSASASSPSSQPSGPSYPSGELSTIEDTHGAQVLYFEHDFCQSFIDGRQGSNACTVISSLNILRWLERDQQFPDSLRVIPCVAGSLDQCLGHRCHAHPNRTPELVVYQHTIGRVSAHNWSCISTQLVVYQHTILPKSPEDLKKWHDESEVTNLFSDSPWTHLFAGKQRRRELDLLRSVFCGVSK